MEFWSVHSMLFLSFLFLYLYLYLYLKVRPNTRKPFEEGFKTYPVLGALLEFLMNRNRFLDWTTRVLRDCPTNTAVFVGPGRVRGIITANLENVEHMLKNRFENFPKGHQSIDHLEDFLGRGILNSDGELWRFQRIATGYELNTKSFRNFAVKNVMFAIREKLLPILSGASETNQVLDLQDLLQRFAFDNVCKLVFNGDSGCLGGDGTAGAKFMRAFEDAATLSSGRFMCAVPLIWKIKKLFNVGSERRLRESIATVHEFADEIIRSRMKDPNRDDEDLLSRFIGTDEISPEFLRDLIISFVLAGSYTTSSALTWFFWNLSSRPDVKRKILYELETIRSRNGVVEGEAFGYEELNDMAYLRAAISESLRLHPPVPVVTKTCLSEDVLPDGTVTGKGWLIAYLPYAMGRMEGAWGSDCTEFKPERVLDRKGSFQEASAFRYSVFQAGPRMCLGKDMAYLQMQSIVASVMERFEIEAVDKDTCPEHLLSVTLRMKGGLPVKVRARV